MSEPEGMAWLEKWWVLSILAAKSGGDQASWSQANMECKHNLSVEGEYGIWDAFWVPLHGGWC